MSQETLTITRGDTTKWDVTVTDENTEAAMDLTGASVWFTVKNSRFEPDSAKLLQKTVGDGITLTDPTAGELRLVLAATDTDDLSPARRYVYDLQVKNASGEIYTTATGPFLVDGDVTRATS